MRFKKLGARYTPNFWRFRKIGPPRTDVQQTVVNPNKDRTLAGKKRIKARKIENRKAHN